MNFLLLNQKYFEKIMCRKREKISIKFNYFPPAIILKNIDIPTADTPSQMLQIIIPGPVGLDIVGMRSIVDDDLSVIRVGWEIKSVKL